MLAAPVGISTPAAPEDRNRRELAGGYGGDFPQIGESEKAIEGTRQQKLQAVSDRFYRGDIADALEAWYIEKGGFLRKATSPRQDSCGRSAQNHLPRITVYKAGPLRRVLISHRRCGCSKAST